MLKAIAQIGGLQLLTMLVHLARTKSLAVILGPEWIGVMAVVDQLLGMVERRHHVIDVDVGRRITLRDAGEKLDIARSRRETVC